MIRHVVMWKFKEGTEAQQREFFSRLQALDGVIPEILRSEVGVDCKGSGNYDGCLIADFADLDALERYKNDPRHKAVSALCKSIRTDRVAVDFEIGEDAP